MLGYYAFCCLFSLDNPPPISVLLPLNHAYDSLRLSIAQQRFDDQMNEHICRTKKRGTTDNEPGTLMFFAMFAFYAHFNKSSDFRNINSDTNYIPTKRNTKLKTLKTEQHWHVSNSRNPPIQHALNAHTHFRTISYELANIPHITCARYTVITSFRVNFSFSTALLPAFIRSITCLNQFIITLCSSKIAVVAAATEQKDAQTNEWTLKRVQCNEFWIFGGDFF